MNEVIEFLKEKFEDWESECQENEEVVQEYLWIYKQLTGEPYFKEEETNNE